MKKKFIITLMFIFCFCVAPNGVHALSGSLSISCNDAIVGQQSTCTIRVNADGEVSGFQANFSVTGAASAVSFSPASGWEGEGDGGSIALYTKTNKSGSINIGTVTFQANYAGKASLNLSGVSIGDVDFNEVPIGSSARSFNVSNQTTTTIKTTTTTKYQSNPNKGNGTPSSVGDNTTAPTIPITENIVPLSLSSLAVDGFDVTYENGAYYCTVNEDTEEVNIIATAADGIIVTGVGPRKLARGKNSVQLVLTDSTQTTNISVVITRPDDSGVYDTKLTSLKVVGYDFAFSPDTYEYTVSIPSSLKEIYVLASSYSDSVVIQGAGLKHLTGDDTVYVKVTYGNLAESNYVIHIKKDHKALIQLILMIIFGVGMFGVTVYSFVNKKKAVKKVTDQSNKELAESNRRFNQSGSNMVINGEKTTGIGQRIVVPTQVIPVNKTVEAVDEEKNINDLETSSLDAESVEPNNQINNNLDLTDASAPTPTPQIKVVKRVVIPTQQVIKLDENIIQNNKAE